MYITTYVDVLSVDIYIYIYLYGFFFFFGNMLFSIIILLKYKKRLLLIL